MESERSSRRAALVTTLAVGAAAAILTAQLLVPPIVGLADNGDFERVMGYVGFRHVSDEYLDRYWAWANTRFAVAQPGWSRTGYVTSELVLAGVARVFVALSGDRLFDIRILGAIHMLMLLVALGMLVYAARRLPAASQLTAAALLVFVFTDVGYVAPFNSFYSQTASLLFLLLLVAVTCEAIGRGRLEGMLLLAFFLAALAFIGSKPQEVVQAPLLALFALRLAGVRRPGWWRQPAVAMALVLVLFAAWYWRRTPWGIRQAALYHTVFLRILPLSPDPRADLAELGLEADWIRYARTSAYSPDSGLNDPEFRAAFDQRYSYRKMWRFYLHHPERLARPARDTAESFFRLRPGLGNFDQSTGAEGRAQARRFALWSDLRARLSDYGAVALPLLLAGNLAAALHGYRRASPRGRLVREGIVVLVAMCALEFAVCALSDAQLVYDTIRHLYVGEAIGDLLIVADATWIVGALATRRREQSLAGRRFPGEGPNRDFPSHVGRPRSGRSE